MKSIKRHKSSSRIPERLREQRMQPDYSGPSLLMASTQIQNGLLTSGMLGTQSSFFSNPSNRCAGEQDEENAPRLSQNLQGPIHLESEKLNRQKNDAKPKTDSTAPTNGLVSGANQASASSKEIGNELPDSEHQPLCTTAGLTQMLLYAKTVRCNCCAKLGEIFSNSRGRMRILLFVGLFVLALISIVILTSAFLWHRIDTTTISEKTMEQSTTQAIFTYPIRSLINPTTQAVCMNVSCLRMASILTEHLGQFRNPVLFNEKRGQCDPASLDKLTELFAFGGSHRQSTRPNNIRMLKQRLLHTIWNSISETLQNIPPEPWEGKWFQKLAYFHQRLISESPTFGIRGNTNGDQPNGNPDPDKSDETAVGSEGSVSNRNPPATTDEDRLKQLLQKGNIAFHGLDNVLINVQLELRVPLFFSAWIKKTHNFGLLETRMPFLDMLIQPELPGLAEMESILRDSRSRRSGIWTEFLSYVNTLLSVVTGQLGEASALSNPLRVTNISSIPKAMSVLFKLRSLGKRTNGSKFKPVRMTVRELMQKTQQSINFPRYLGAIMAANRSGVIPRDLAVWVADVEYYEKLGNLLYQTSFNELQDYVTFCILHKYAGYVYKPLAKLKRKFLEPLAESYGMNKITHWPQLLELASPGLRLLILKQWSWRYIERASSMIKTHLFEPLLRELKKMLDAFIPDPTSRSLIDSKISKMKMTIVEASDVKKIEAFYQSWQIRRNESLLEQVVGFNTFLSLKALNPDYIDIIQDPGLTSNGKVISHYLEEKNILQLSVLSLNWPYLETDMSVPSYANFGPLWYSIGRTLVSAFLIEGAPHNISSLLGRLDPNGSVLPGQKILSHYLSKYQHILPAFEQQIVIELLTIELVGRTYVKYLEEHENMSVPVLFEFTLPNDVIFYVWVFQSVCDSTIQTRTFQTMMPKDNSSVGTCETLRVASQLSPTFRKLLNCPRTSTDRNMSGISTELRSTFADRTFYKSRKNNTT